MKKCLVLTGLFVLLQSCTQLDNYMLGKDNTPKPSPLAPVAFKIKMTPNWSVSLGKPNKSATYLKLKPVIRGNIIYTADASGLVQATQKSNGHILWTKQIEQGVVSGPTVSNGYIALGTNASHVVVLNQRDGSEVWRASVSGDVLSKPAISHHKLIAKTIDGNLYAFDLKTGEKIWVVDHGSPSLILKASSSPVILDNTVLVGFSDGKLDAIDLNLGHVVWQKSIAYARGSSDVERLVDIDADPIVQNNIVYLASYQGYIGALSLSDGQFIWNKPASTYRNIAMDASTLYMTDSDDVVWAYDKHNGQIKWKQPSFKARGLTDPVLMGDHLVLGDKMGFLHLISTQNGELLSRTQLSGAIYVSPSVSGHRVYVMTANGKLNCISVG